VEFYANIDAKFKEWKYNQIFIINGRILEAKKSLCIDYDF
jgi:hypothetical protein